MKTQVELIKEIHNLRVLPLFYDDDVEVCKQVVVSLYDSGIRCIEFTNRGHNAIAIFKALILLRNDRMPDLLLAIGTIKTSNEASLFIELGADFLISPFYDQSIADICYLHKKLWIPGCMTPTEIHIAEQGGCSIIKLFPGNTLGTAYVSAIKPLFPNLNFMVTGGVDVSKSNLHAWFEAGVFCVGLGSKLITSNILSNKDFITLENETKKLLNVVSLIQESHE